MPSNACFCNINSTGVPRLRRVLRGLAWLYPDIGYCQGTGMVKNILNILTSKRLRIGKKYFDLEETLTVKSLFCDCVIS